MKLPLLSVGGTYSAKGKGKAVSIIVPRKKYQTLFICIVKSARNNKQRNGIN